MRLLTSSGQQPNLEASHKSDLEVGCWLTLPVWDHEMELKHGDCFIFVTDLRKNIRFLKGYLRSPWQQYIVYLSDIVFYSSSGEVNNN